MRIYFLSERAAGLKLNGAYMGVIDGFEKFIDVDLSQKILAEVLPDGDTEAVNFFIDDNFFKAPPDFADVYLTEGDAVIYFNRFQPRVKRLEVLAQTNFNGLQVTLFLNGDVYLNCEGKTCNLYHLPQGFEKAKLTLAEIGGKWVVLVEGENCLSIISESGKQIFLNPAASWTCGDKLKVTVNFATCAACRAVCTFAYDGEKMTLEDSQTREYAPINEEIMHFAFFESVLTRADFEKYLCAELKQSAAALPEFLGDFIDVAVPYSKFYERHGNIKAAGLVYPAAKNLFKIKYFAVDIDGGKITNVYEVE